jgi:P27 family predicted phage terminase small subunit
MARRHRPALLKVITGSKRLPPHPEPDPPGDLREAPSWLTPSQREGWDYAIENAPRGLLKRLDRSILAIWVIAEDLHRQAAQKVAEHGMLIKTDAGPTQSPFMHVLNKQSLIMMKAAATLGIGPASRAGIAAAPGPNHLLITGAGQHLQIRPRDFCTVRIEKWFSRTAMGGGISLFLRGSLWTGASQRLG